MKLKQALAYRFDDTRKSLIVFYIAIFCSFVLFCTLLALMGDDSRMNGMEMASMIFLFVLGLNSFKPQLRFFLQNGISRRTMYLSQIANVLSASLIMAVIDSLYPLIVRQFFDYTTLYQTFYAGNMFHEIIWNAMLYTAIGCAGFLITVLYYHMNKLVKIIVSAVVPVLLFVGLPVLGSIYPQLQVGEVLVKLITFIFGIDYKTGVGNPLLSALWLAVIGAVTLLIVYPFVRRATLKES